MGISKASPRRIDSALMRIEAVKLRQQKFSYVEIAEKLKIDRSTARKYVLKSLELIVEECKEETSQLREMELANLDRYQSKLEQDLSTSQTYQDRIKIIDSIRRIMIDRSSYYTDLKPKQTVLVQSNSVISTIPDKELTNLTAEELLRIYEDAVK